MRQPHRVEHVTMREQEQPTITRSFQITMSPAAPGGWQV